VSKNLSSGKGGKGGLPIQERRGDSFKIKMEVHDEGCKLEGGGRTSGKHGNHDRVDEPRSRTSKPPTY